MSGGVVEWVDCYGVTVAFRADAISQVAGPEPGDTRVRVYVDASPTPVYLDGATSWMEAMRVWRRELAAARPEAGELASVKAREAGLRGERDRLAEDLGVVQADRDDFRAKFETVRIDRDRMQEDLHRANDRADALARERDAAKEATGIVLDALPVEEKADPDRVVFLEAQSARLAEELSIVRESCARAVDRAEAAERDVERLRNRLESDTCPDSDGSERAAQPGLYCWSGERWERQRAAFPVDHQVYPRVTRLPEDGLATGCYVVLDTEEECPGSEGNARREAADEYAGAEMSRLRDERTGHEGGAR